VFDWGEIWGFRWPLYGIDVVCFKNIPCVSSGVASGIILLQNVRIAVQYV
jgi:hypothetical protein